MKADTKKPYFFQRVKRAKMHTETAKNHHFTPPKKTNVAKYFSTNKLF